ncbi:hypothetical protein IJI91_02280 [Candidatus Saccharibacteria bacterium]|nr:hypothetical protein [Candidatus Saccharibacteria bacterium]
MNPNEEENNNSLNNSADTPAPEESAVTPEAAPEPAPESTPEPATKSEPAPAQKSATVAVLLLSIAAVLIIVGIIVTIMLISTNNNGSNSYDDEDIVTDLGTTLTCSAAGSGAEASALAINGLESYDLNLSAYYDSNDSLTSLELSEEYDFDSAENTTAYINERESAHNKLLEGLNLSSDSFDASFDASENMASIYRFAEADALNADTASIFNLSVKDGTVDTSIDGIKNAYSSISNLNYECAIQDVDAEEEE